MEEKDDIDYLDADEVMMLVEDIAEGMLHLRTHLPVAATISPTAAVTVSVEENNTKSDFVWGGDNAPVSDTDTEAAGTRTTTATGGFATLVQEDKLRRRARVLTRAELILLLSELPSRLHLQPQPRHQGRICVGMLGYPNVGKSSAINTILAVSKSSHGEMRLTASPLVSVLLVCVSRHTVHVDSLLLWACKCMYIFAQLSLHLSVFSCVYL